MTMVPARAAANVPRIAFERPQADALLSPVEAALLLLPHLERGNRIDAVALRGAMERACGGSDAEGAWDWKMAYDACEAATVLFLRKFGPAIRDQAASPAGMLQMLGKVAALLPSHTRRSQESQALQQFSTPIELAFVAATAAAIAPADLVLEPSAGTGLLAIFAELVGGSLLLNELAAGRAGLLGKLFPGTSITCHDAAHIHDHLDGALRPSVVLMNPPFSVAAHVDGAVADAALRHVASALTRVADGGRLVAITGASVSPDHPSWRDTFVRLQERGRVVFSAAIDGRVYARHGTTVETRLTVIDGLPAPDPEWFPASPGMAPDAATLLSWVLQHLPPRLPVDGARLVRVAERVPVRTRSAPAPSRRSSAATAFEPADAELAYETVDWAPAEAGRLTEALYEPYGLQSVRIDGARPHPTRLVQSAAMASVAPPKPTYRPRLPANVVTSGLLSDAQLETVIYAGEAHSGHLAGSWMVDETFDVVSAAPDDGEKAVRFRRGWMLGDGTGAGKGRQVAGILLDNWLQGRRRAVWISKSDKLLEDARRDWSALGMERLLITPLARFRQGSPIRLEQGILFVTYATLRTDAREERVSRVQQIVDWLGSDFDGVIVFDESHAMANAAGGKGERGEQAPSQQGRAGLRLQHALPNARVVYVSATGATAVHNLAYAQRLGLWGGEDFPFATRAEFVQAIEAGGVAAMEVLARDLKALGLYAARSLSYEGVEYELVEHTLTPEQIRIYDAYAGAFQVIHNNVDAALQAANVTGERGTLNAQAKSAARSAFESAKQRFFGLFGRTAFLAEKVLGNVFSSGVKVLVLAVIVGIGSTIFGQFTNGFNNPPTIDDALTLILAALALLGLSIFGAGIANGLVAGGPQLGTGAAIGTGLAAAGAGVAGAALATGTLGAAGRAIGGVAGAGATAAGGMTAGFRAGGVRGIASAAGAAATSPLRRAAAGLRDNFEAGAVATRGGGRPTRSGPAGGSDAGPPPWANRMRRHQTMHRGASAAHHAVRAGDHPSGGSAVDLSEGS